MEAASQKFLLCHAIPSRLRVKVQDIHREEKAAAALEHWLATQTGVEGVRPARSREVSSCITTPRLPRFRLFMIF
jgi:hypothetical protein